MCLAKYKKVFDIANCLQDLLTLPIFKNNGKETGFTFFQRRSRSSIISSIVGLVVLVVMSGYKATTQNTK